MSKIKNVYTVQLSIKILVSLIKSNWHLIVKQTDYIFFTDYNTKMQYVNVFVLSAVYNDK